ncbi:hypothetical protein LXA43DRAFT_1104573 [Ganoderma leucocontextum]|nr:hypothetical protein LXA43DRAFT_1104573 [Ganoderma leucocontextum]
MSAKTTVSKIADLPKEVIIDGDDKLIISTVIGDGVDDDVEANEARLLTKDLLRWWKMAASKKARKAGVIRFLQGAEHGSGKLVRKSLDAFQSDYFDGGYTFRTERFTAFHPITSLKAESAGKVGLRPEGIDHALVGNRLMFWPPPTQAADITSQASWAWEVDGSDEDTDLGGVEADAVKHLEATIGSAVILFRLYSRGNRASRRWLARPTGPCTMAAPVDVTWTEPVEADAEERVFRAVRRCALCSISSLYLAGHDHVQCPYIGTLDKVRGTLGFLKIGIKDGVLSFPREKAPVDYGKRISDIEANFADLSKRLKALEDAAKVDSKKRKREETKKEGDKAKKAKKETGGKTAKAKKGGDNGEGGAAGPSKGKGKAKAN